MSDLREAVEREIKSLEDYANECDRLSEAVLLGAARRLRAAVARPALPAPEPPPEPTVVNPASGVEIPMRDGWVWACARVKLLESALRGSAVALEVWHIEEKSRGATLPAEHAPPTPSDEAIDAAEVAYWNGKGFPAGNDWKSRQARALAAAYAVDFRGSRPALAGRGPTIPTPEELADGPAADHAHVLFEAARGDRYVMQAEASGGCGYFLIRYVRNMEYAWLEYQTYPLSPEGEGPCDHCGESWPRRVVRARHICFGCYENAPHVCAPDNTDAGANANESYFCKCGAKIVRAALSGDQGAKP